MRKRKLLIITAVLAAGLCICWGAMSFANPGDPAAKTNQPIAKAPAAVSTARGSGAQPTAAATPAPARNAVAVVSEQEQAEKDRQLQGEKQRLESPPSAAAEKDRPFQAEQAKPDASSPVKEGEAETQPPPALWLAAPPTGASGQEPGAEAVKPLSPEEMEAQAIQQKLEELAIQQKQMEEYSGQETPADESMLVLPVGSAITAEGVAVPPYEGAGGAPSDGAPRDTAPGVKISQVYGSGGNSQSPLFNDYVEIYNSSSAPVSLSGWSVQYAASGGLFTAAQTAALPAVSLLAGQYLLVQFGTGGSLLAGQTPVLPTPQVSNVTNMSGTDFKVALVSSTTFLPTGTPTYAGNPTLKDFVGAGTLANWNDTAAAGGAFLAANNAPPPSTAHAIYRLECGARDTDNSRNDWAVGFPAPRNTATALNLGITVIGTALPLTLEETQTARLTATPYRCATNDLGPDTTVSVDTTLIGGGAVALLDGGVAPDEVASDGIYTALVTVAVGTAVGTKSLPVSVSGGSSGGSYISIEVKPTTTPDNDNCYSATAVTSLPYSTSGATFTGATVESNSLSATNISTASMGYKRGLWYTVVGTGNTITASLCSGPALDSVMLVLCGSCDGLTIIGANDTSPLTPCSAGNASVAWCSTVGTTYYIWVSPYSTAASVAAFTLTIADDGVPCTTAFPCINCVGTPGPFTETEPGYGIHTNDGCNSTPNLFTNIAAPGVTPTVLRGTSRGMFGNRDVDEYRFQATGTGVLTMTIDTLGTQAQAQLYSLAAGGLCPQVNVVNTPLYVARCVSTIQTATGAVTAGTFYAIQVVGGIGIQVAPAPATSFFGGQMPGGTTYQYAITVSILPAGACCKVDGTCAILTPDGCAAIPGAIYQGNDTTCTPNPCPPAGACCMYDGTCVNSYTQAYCISLGGTWQGAGTVCGLTYVQTAGGAWEDISSSGTEIVSLLLPSADDGGCTLPIGFTFNFYGLPYTNVWVISNGRLDVGATAYTSGYMPTAIPLAAAPNNVIAALWGDLNCTGKSVRWQLFGTEPSRYLIVQYTGVVVYNTTYANTFQMVLFEGSDCIELRYQLVQALSGTYRAGIENSTGTVGKEVTSSVAAGASIRLCPITLTCPVNGACCQPDDTCIDGLQSACVPPGVFQGAGSLCTPTLCAAPVGACCFANGSCTQLKEYFCLPPVGTGTSWSLGVLCEPNPCPQPDVACCYTDGSCLMQTAAACTLAGGTPSGYPSTCTPNTCPLPGDSCLNPLVADVSTLPYVNTNTTCGRLNDYSNTCLGSYDGAEDIIYKLVITAPMCLNFNVTGTTTADNWLGIAVDDECPPAATGCIAYATSTTNIVNLTNVNLAVGTYYIMIDDYPSPPCVNFTLTITKCPEGACCIPSTGSCSVMTPAACTAAFGVYMGNDVPCETGTCPQPCTLNCEPTDLVEPEACGLDTNGGCNSAPLYPMTPILLGDTYCGTAWANANLRDTDWYSITLPAATELTWTVTSEFPSALYILGGTCGGTVTTYASAYGGNCAAAVATACVPHGTYYLFVAPGTSAGGVFNGWPCGTSNDYRAALTGVPCEATYCTSAATSTADETIDNFTLNTINNTTSGCDLYDDFTYLSTDLMRSATYALSITIGDCEGTSCYNKWAVVYIDWNGDKDFTEPNELAWASGQLTNLPCPTMVVTGNITVPVTANLGETRMRVIVKEGTSATAPPPCGTYTWGATEDYVVNIQLAPAYSVAPGVDCWTTVCDGKTKYGFAATPLPLGFFDPGSDPFDGTVALGGDGLGPYGTDTTVQRHGPLDFATVPSSDTVPIELVALGLLSCQPITVTYGGGGGELWDVKVGLSPTLPPWGLMTATMTSPIGGTFDASFNVQPKFTFTRRSDGAVRTLDTAGLPGTPMVLTSHGVPWRTTSPFAACSLDFFPGMLEQGGLPCCVETCHEGPSPDHPHCVWPPECIVHCIGACCFADGTCQEIETAAACVLLGGTFGGIGTNCTPNLCPQPGRDCDHPVVVGIPGALPYTNVNTTCGMVNDYANTCLGSYDGGEDIIYRLDVTQDMCLKAVLSTTSTYTGMSIDDSCPGDVTTCLYMATNYGAGGVTLNNVMLYASVGTYYVMIDTFPSPTCIPTFTLTITACPTGACCAGGTCTIQTPEACALIPGLYVGDNEPCVPDPCSLRACCFWPSGTCVNLSEADCAAQFGTWYGTQFCWTKKCPTPGDNCGIPVMVALPAALPYTDPNQYTCGRVNDYADTCLGYYDGGEDIIYQLNVTEPICVNITATGNTPANNWIGVGLDSYCPLGATCLRTATSSGTVVTMTNVTLMTGTYYVMVDTWPSPACLTDFTLTIVASTGCPSGACCKTDGTCEVMFQVACTALGGTFGGVGSVCPGFVDCQQPPNLVDDYCDILVGTSQDCQPNGIPDECDIASGFSHDWDINGVPDECQPDCQPNGWPDFCDLPGGCLLGGCSADPDCGDSLDCQPNGIPDECDLGGGPPLVTGYDDGSSEDALGNASYNHEICWIHHFTVSGPVLGVQTTFGYTGGSSGVLPNDPFRVFVWSDPDGNGDPSDGVLLYQVAGAVEAAAIESDVFQEVLFATPVAVGTSYFVGVSIAGIGYQAAMDNVGTIVDESWFLYTTTPPIDPNNFVAILFNAAVEGFPTNWMLRVITGSASADCNGNTVPDECDIAQNPALDCDDNGQIDSCEIDADPTKDCNNNDILDVCEVPPICTGGCEGADPPCSCDCNDNLIPDECEVPPLGTGPDCQPDGIPDVCQLADNDCQPNGIPDECDIAFGGSYDCQLDGIPDECQLGGGGGGGLTEGFEGGVVPPTGWTEFITDPGYNWKICTTSAGHTGLYAADVEYNPALTPQDEWLLTPTITVTGNVTVAGWSMGSYYWGVTPYNNYDLEVWVVIGAVGGGDDIQIGEPDTETWLVNWTWYAFGPYNYAASSSTPFRVGFRYVGADGAQAIIDDIAITWPAGPPSNDCNQNGVPDECDPWACCTADGVCHSLDAADCADLPGVFNKCVPCEPNPCPGYCATGRADVNNDGVCNGLDIQYFVDCLLVPGLTQACACADMDNDGDDDMDDVAPFVTALLDGVCLPPP